MGQIRPRFLNGCAKSVVLAQAFEDAGFDSWTCDILPSEGWRKHIQDDVLNHLNDGWDLAIFHPPCIYLSWAATAYWNAPGRYKLRLDAINFFITIAEAPIYYLCLENPLGIMEQVYRPSDQTIHPYYFGDAEMKRTCLWLKNLPKLTYQLETDMFAMATATPKPEPIYIDKISGKKRYFTDALTGASEDIKGYRSRNFPGISKAMADQWGRYLLQAVRD